MKLPEDFTDRVGDRLLDPSTSKVWRFGAGLVLLLLVIDLGFGWYWSREPELISAVPVSGHEVVGEATAAMLIQVSSTLLDKPGGYLTNDLLPHRLWLDNMPSWEYGVLVQVRDMVRVMRRDMSRSQSASQEDTDLVRAEPRFNFDNASWAMPATESEYRGGIKALQSYLDRLRSQNEGASFYARADNLNYWLGDVQKRLGSLSLKLSQSVGRDQLDLDAVPLPENTKAMRVKTPWSKVDNVFYESRGASWALIHLLRAAEVDFAEVLEKKNAAVSFNQVIRELEATQETVWSPMILNGSGFGVLANHSLVMANYISRANAALLDLRQLLTQG